MFVSTLLIRITQYLVVEDLDMLHAVLSYSTTKILLSTEIFTLTDFLNNSESANLASASELLKDHEEMLLLGTTCIACSTTGMQL